MVTKTKRAVRPSPKVMLMEALNSKSLLQRERDDLREEIRQLKFSLSSQRQENHALEVALAEETARAEAFEFVIRLQYGAEVVKP